MASGAFMCSACGSQDLDEFWSCHSCGFAQPTDSSGILLFDPELSNTLDGYDPAWFKELASLEEDNFWFRARNRIILRLMERYLSSDGVFLELGCGSGYVLQAVRGQMPNWTMYASELHLEGLRFAQARVGNDVTFMQLDARRIPFRENLDAVGAFDVIEHIESDGLVVSQIYSALRPEGLVFITVPQHMWLWSRYDELGHHWRRYERGELENLLIRSGFQIVYSSSFMTTLLPAITLSRILNRRKSHDEYDVLQELRISKLTNRVLGGLMSLDLLLLRLGIRLPVGSSRVIVARKALSR